MDTKGRMCRHLHSTNKTDALITEANIFPKIWEIGFYTLRPRIWYKPVENVHLRSRRSAVSTVSGSVAGWLARPLLLSGVRRTTTDLTT